MTEQETAASSTARMQFHYIKSPDYREVACHGALGGPTPQRLIWMSLFSERTPIPRVVEYAVEGIPGQEVTFIESAVQPTHVETRAGIIRHVEVSAYLDIETAKRVHIWLGEQIAILESAK